MKNRVLLLLLLFVTPFALAQAQEKVNDELNALIRKHGLELSQAGEIAGWMTDVYGPRLTGSPMLDKATDWAQKTLKEWGMKNVHLESWGPFGRGWELSHFEMHATAPSYFPIIAYPKAWSPSVKGSGEVVYLQAGNEEELAAYKGKLAGKFVLFDTIRVVTEGFEPNARRHDAESLLEMANAPEPTPRPRRNYNNLGNTNFNQILWQFLADEQPLAVLDRSYKGDLGTVFVSGARTAEGRAQQEGQKVVPQVTLSVEHYNQIFRNLQRGLPVTLSIELQSAYTNPDGMEHNIIAEIPGTDLKDEVVMFGAHFDSWHTATGATDNAAGSTVMMEAARILLETIKESGIKPRRTLRLALWTGEEQGLLGSRGYSKEHFADFPPNSFTPQSLKPAQKSVSAYYNLDNGTGKIRGVYLQGNAEVAPIFRAWLQPFKDLDAATLSMSNTGGTDHLTFDAVGIPGFQFIQEPMAYFARTHHSNMDNFDHLVVEDLAQAATIVASFVLHTALRDEMLPRKPFETEEAKKEAEKR
ncbi:M20/M25/M40 family metallo-hydrolase [Neolewinella lacunae]|uniref:Carboxypeptidase Q n=1 Tax=Neolewinella lacunae TaxID=1517758 RepID=A0A923T835_9BACT|nr:M28 family peptidase [Neolewinella lacunae]MBC6993538.1 M20/M25/M40 family metallo-hydrolase [Neolewinella lacunae]MDN3636186.1 M20/M25/M40 family metallo-hydrolase [Neolewinella lacunae]